MASPVSHTVVRHAAAGVERLFDTVVAEDVLPKVLHRHALLPAVTGTRDLTGPWDTPGSQRTVVLADGSTSRERVLRWERPREFGYRVDQFPARLAALADHAEGSWRFDGDETISSFVWTYSFVPRNAFARAPLAVFVRALWAGYMAGCADRCVALAEK